MNTPIELSHPAFHDEDAARQYLEELRWADGVVCPHCGGMEKIAKLGGASMGPGWWHCGDCRQKFTVRVGSIFERSHIPLHKWLLAFRLMASSKKGVSAHQLHRTLGITYKSAWFLAHRVREAMKDTDNSPLGGSGKVVEADETFLSTQPYEFNNEKGWRRKTGVSHMKKVVTLVERGGRARSVKIDDLHASTIRSVVIANADRKSALMTDEARYYRRLGKEFASHETVNHRAGEYGRGTVSTNTVEGFFSIFKRGMKGIYQHCSEDHLHRYLAEFDFRYSNRVKLGCDDVERTTRALKGAEGKRLTYRQPRIG